MIIVIGGGPAGFFGAITAREVDPSRPVIILEKNPEVLAKVKISGGGRCNVTHACFDPRDLATHYPRGHKELIGPFHKWGPSETSAWFAERGVALKTETDGRMFCRHIRAVMRRCPQRFSRGYIDNSRVISRRKVRQRRSNGPLLGACHHRNRLIPSTVIVVICK